MKKYLILIVCLLAYSTAFAITPLEESSNPSYYGNTSTLQAEDVKRTMEHNAEKSNANFDEHEAEIDALNADKVDKTGIVAGSGIVITGSGTAADPFTVSNGFQLYIGETAPAQLTNILWADTDQVADAVVFKIHNGTTWVQQAIGESGTGDNLGSAGYADVVALWASGACSGYLKSDGTCDSGYSLPDTAVIPGSYTYGSFTVDQQGRMTAASSGTAPPTLLSQLETDASNRTVTETEKSVWNGKQDALGYIAQQRVTGTCSEGSSIRVINSDGTVSCETDDTGSGSIPDGTVDGQIILWATDQWVASAFPGMIEAGSYTPTGTWNWTSATVTWPIFNQPTTSTSGGLSAQYIDWNASSGGNSIANKPTIPSLVSQLTNDSGFITSETDDQTAGEVNITDAGEYFTGTTVEAALQELYTTTVKSSNGVTVDADIETFILTPSLANFFASVDDEGAFASTLLSFGTAAGVREGLDLEPGVDIVAAEDTIVGAPGSMSVTTGNYIATSSGTAPISSITTKGGFCLEVEGDYTVILDPPSGVTIYLDGAAETADENITSDGSSGSLVCCKGRTSTTLSCLGDGTWNGATD